MEECLEMILWSDVVGVEGGLQLYITIHQITEDAVLAGIISALNQLGQSIDDHLR